jgi:muramidase (phage lysozyme)
MRNLRSFLDTIAVSEIGNELLALTENGYNVIVGSRPSMPLLFGSYRDHPRVRINLRADDKRTPQNEDLTSTAAGRYQILARNSDAYKVLLGLKDFGPASQDAIATQMIRECHAYDDVMAGRLADAVAKCSSRWASFPGNNYEQRQNNLEFLRSAFIKAGGLLASV